MKRLLLIGLAVVTLSSCVTSSGSSSRADARGADDVETVSIYAENSSIVVRGLERSDVIFDQGYTDLERDDEEIDFTVENQDEFRVGVPFGTEVYIENSNGSVIVAGTRGNVEAELSDTEVFVYDPGEYVDIETTNAAVLLVKRFGTIDEYYVTTSNAPVNAGVPAGDLNVRLETSNGIFRINNLAVTVTRRVEEEIEGYIGSEDGGWLEIESTNGEITLQPAAAYARAAAASRTGTAATTDGRDGILGNIGESISDTLADLGIISRRRGSPGSTSGGGSGSAAADDDAAGSEAAAAEDEAAAGAAAGGAAAGVARGGAATAQDVPEDVTPRRTAVFPFREINTAASDGGLGEALSEMLITAIANSPAITVIERSQIDTMLDETRFQLSGVTSTEESIEIGNILNAEIVILGSVSRFGGSIELDVRVIRLETGEVLFTQYGSAAEAEVRDMVNALGAEISAAIARMPSRSQSGQEASE